MAMEPILARINELERERHELFRQAGERLLSARERERLHHIERQLGELWQARRGALAGRPDPLYPVIEGRWERRRAA